MKKFILALLCIGTLAYAGADRQLNGKSIKVGPTGGVLTLPNTTDTVTVSGDATSTNTVSKIVKRDSLGDFAARVITATLTGNSSTATALFANPTDCSVGKATGIDASGNLTCSAVGLADLSETITVPYGGTGLTTLTNQGVMLGQGTSTVQFVSPCASGGVLTSSGSSTWSCVVPSLIVSNGANERVERLKVASCASSPCTITSQSGEWVSSVTRGGAGLYSVNIVGSIFTVAPTCICVARGGGAGPTCSLASTSTSTLDVRTENPIGSGADSAVDIICMGTK